MQTLVGIPPLRLPMKSWIAPWRSVVGTYSKLLACLVVSLTVTDQQTTGADVCRSKRRETLHKLLVADVRSSRVIKRMLVRCPITKKLNATGMVIEEDVFAATEVRSGTVACVHCGEKHAWNKTEVILAR